jgi:alkylation response protein AidB-like acyl-CoA dehydrogenase
MDYAYTDDEIRFRDEVRAFLAKEWGPPDPVAGRDVHDAERERAFMSKVASRGWLTMGWPEEYGGTSFSPMERYILSQEMNRAGAPFPLYNVNVLGPLLIKFASEEAKSELLPRMRAGALKFVLGYTEPETGSDLASLRTRAERQGDGYVINGQKLYGLPHPADGDIIFLAARTDPDAPIRKGISIFLIDSSAEGVTVTQNRTLGGSHVGATYYDNVYVPASRRLGEENEGWRYIRECMDLDRVSGIPYAHFPVLFEMLVAFAAGHERDGRRLADEPWVIDRIGRLAIEVEAAQLLQEMMACKVYAGAEVHAESSIIKAYCTELESRLTEFGRELVGELAALTTEAGVDEFIGRLNFLSRLNVAMTIVGGTNEIQRNIIALQGLGLPRG